MLLDNECSFKCNSGIYMGGNCHVACAVWKCTCYTPFGPGSPPRPSSPLSPLTPSSPERPAKPLIPGSPGADKTKTLI